VDELGRRRDLAIGPDRPVAVVEVEIRDDAGQVDIGLPIGVDRADIAPVGDADSGAKSARRSARNDAPTALPFLTM
jgi:hypothetical protein